jgi:hypothetical protein
MGLDTGGLLMIHCRAPMDGTMNAHQSHLEKACAVGAAPVRQPESDCHNNHQQARAKSCTALRVTVVCVNASGLVKRPDRYLAVCPLSWLIVSVPQYRKLRRVQGYWFGDRHPMSE